MVHIVGIGGIGMSAIAQAYLDAGVEVSGSDRLADKGDMTDTLLALSAQGVKISPQDGSGITSVTDCVVVSTAIEADNPDKVAAERRKIPVMHRSAALASLVKGKRLIAVAGTCGKSTTAAILGHLLEGAGLDPTVINGAAVVGWGSCSHVGSVRRGGGELCVIEADESDRSFLRYRPEYAIITNETSDHFDPDETISLFSEFRKLVARDIIDGQPAPSDILPHDGWNGRFMFHDKVFNVPLPGTHNVYNSWLAVRLASLLGIDDATLIRTLATFRGVERRMQRIGRTRGGALVVDDFGHNPDKLSAAINAIKPTAARTVILWRPHGYGPLRHLLNGLADAFAAAMRPMDELLLLPVYDAGGTADRTVNSDALLAALNARGVTNVSIVPNMNAARTALLSRDGSDAAFLICGARDPDLPRLARKLI